MLQYAPSLFSTALLLKLTVVVWIALLVRMVVQQERKQHSLLAVLCTVASTASAVAVYTTNPVPYSCAALIAMFVAVICWLHSADMRWNWMLRLAVIVALALAAGGFYRSVEGAQPIAAWFLLAANCLAASVAVVHAIEMTGFMSPTELRDQRSDARRMMLWLSSCSLLALLCASLTMATVFLGAGPISSVDNRPMREEFQAIAWLFAAAVVVVQFVVWYGLRRTLLTASGESKAVGEKQEAIQTPREWGSLTISAWIAVVALLVALAVPMSWPWKVDVASDAMIGELLE